MKLVDQRHRPTGSVIAAADRQSRRRRGGTGSHVGRGNFGRHGHPHAQARRQTRRPGLSVRRTMTRHWCSNARLSATRKYPAVISFTEGDTLDEEARVQVPPPPMPSVNRARGRIGVDYMGTHVHGNSGVTNARSRTGRSPRHDAHRRHLLESQRLLARTADSNTYTGNSHPAGSDQPHLSPQHDVRQSELPLGRGFRPHVPAVGHQPRYHRRRILRTAIRPRITARHLSPDRRPIPPPGATVRTAIGGAFVNFEGGSFDAFRYTSTSGLGFQHAQMEDRPPVRRSLKTAVYYKRYVAIYDSLQADSPVGIHRGGSPGPASHGTS